MKMKKILSLLLAFVLMLGISATALFVSAEDEPEPVTISGPAGAMRTNNGGAITIGPFEITGDPAPTVTARFSNGNFTNFAWNPDTKMVSFNVGSVGNNSNQTATIVADNGSGEVTHVIQMRIGTVTNSPALSPNPPALTLRQGEGGAVSATIGASNSPASIVITGGDVIDGKKMIRWVIPPATGTGTQTGQFVVEPGLPAGTYPVTFNVTNFIGTARAATFTLTVIEDVPTLTAPASIPASSTLASTMHLGPEYGAASTGAFSAVSVIPATITLETDTWPEITFNEETKALDVAPGLAQGSYAVTLKAANSVGEATVTYTIVVWDEEPVVPFITGPSGAFRGRNLTTPFEMGPYYIEGYPEPAITVVGDSAMAGKVTWDPATKKVTVSDTNGTSNNSNYPIRITATTPLGSTTFNACLRIQTNAVTAQPTANVNALNNAIILPEGYDLYTSANVTIGANNAPGSYAILNGTNIVDGKEMFYFNSPSMTAFSGSQNVQLKVLPGLPIGTYTVDYMTTNFSVSTNRTATVIVKEDVVFTGSETLMIPVGYTGESTDEYTLTGYPDPVVTILSGSEYATWNDTTNKLDIVDGIEPGIYTIEMEARNSINDVQQLTFTLTVSIPATITGPDKLTLREGYKVISTEPFVITGVPEPLVEIIEGPPQVTWNNTTKQFDIARGITEGVYIIKLRASAVGVQPDAIHVFTLTISPPSAPVITGPTKLSLPTGYNQMASVQYLVTGAPVIKVELTSDQNVFSWNDANKTLEIAPGLAKGSYEVKMTASNGTLPNSELTFTLVISDAPDAPIIKGRTHMMYRGEVHLTSDQPIVKWSSSSEYVEVDANGKVTSLKKMYSLKTGVVTIYAEGYNGLVTEHVIDIRPNLLQWIVIFVFFGWIWL